MARGRPSKKQLILDTAQRLFCERGYQGTTIDLVVQSAGVSKPTVYSHFPSKQALWQAMLEQAIAASQEQRARLDIEATGWFELIPAGFAQLAAQPQMLAIYRIMLGEQHKMEPESRALFSAFEEGLERWCDRVLQAQSVNLDAQQRFMLRALCREGVLQPALRQQSIPMIGDLATLIQRALAPLG
ncbi:TetR/AcrR family transcriptional regulator [Marinobacterium rhizophilum]|uniref:TetR/AcrR family transcriptional regulator n=1 Tax=Marinobacterium rhizophilum TaxID=420402 RepID=A0ABY5HKN4_9GAMM|nr:TetR/AcrR family transcriptional regulator [Marinobacterium rhizophilum]UTW12153.1 TetR/AcrR family transcriptional regulator [Marinobacterium rhizophilum]